MTEYDLFYYPYASFTNALLPLLELAAPYFDKLVILDPVGASWVTVGADHVARDAVRLLKDAGILEIVTASETLAKYAAPLADAIRRDMADREFLQLCEDHSQASGKQRWTLSLAKVPQDVQTDESMRRLMGDFTRDVLAMAGQFSERATGEYRYADFPLALGEAIMMNHALLTGLLHSGATPITDDPFHSQVLAHELQRMAQEPVIRQAIASRAEQGKLKAGALATAAFTDAQVNLPILRPAVPLAEVLESRQKDPDALARVRETLGLMARRIEAEPWSAEFASEIETKTVPELIVQLTDAARARDAWLGTATTKNRLKAAGIAVGVASGVLAVVTAPVSPVALAIAGLGIVSGSAIPGAEWLLDWRDGRKSVQENGLHYLLSMKDNENRKIR